MSVPLNKPSRSSDFKPKRKAFRSADAVKAFDKGEFTWVWSECPDPLNRSHSVIALLDADCARFVKEPVAELHPNKTLRLLP